MSNKQFDIIAFAIWTVLFLSFLGCLLWLGNHPATVITGLIWGLVSAFGLVLYDDTY